MYQLSTQLALTELEPSHDEIDGMDVNTDLGRVAPSLSLAFAFAFAFPDSGLIDCT
jgi:hypothetical protein